MGRSGSFSRSIHSNDMLDSFGDEDVEFPGDDAEIGGGVNASKARGGRGDGDGSLHSGQGGQDDTFGPDGGMDGMDGMGGMDGMEDYPDDGMDGMDGGDAGQGGPRFSDVGLRSGMGDAEGSEDGFPVDGSEDEDGGDGNGKGKGTKRGAGESDAEEEGEEGAGMSKSSRRKRARGELAKEQAQRDAEAAREDEEAEEEDGTGKGAGKARGAKKKGGKAGKGAGAKKGKRKLKLKKLVVDKEIKMDAKYLRALTKDYTSITKERVPHAPEEVTDQDRREARLQYRNSSNTQSTMTVAQLFANPAAGSGKGAKFQRLFTTMTSSDPLPFGTGGDTMAAGALFDDASSSSTFARSAKGGKGGEEEEEEAEDIERPRRDQGEEGHDDADLTAAMGDGGGGGAFDDEYPDDGGDMQEMPEDDDAGAGEFDEIGAGGDGSSRFSDIGMRPSLGGDGMGMGDDDDVPTSERGGSPRADRRDMLAGADGDSVDAASSQDDGEDAGGKGGKGKGGGEKLLPRTRAMQTLLRRELKDKDEICFQELAEGESRHGVAGCFFELLVLKTKGLIELNQDEAYVGDEKR
jgi:hypothetical protein